MSCTAHCKSLAAMQMQHVNFSVSLARLQCLFNQLQPSGHGTCLTPVHKLIIDTVATSRLGCASYRHTCIGAQTPHSPEEIETLSSTQYCAS